jgi:anaerobic ribonucleoside-triphosphate reductase
MIKCPRCGRRRFDPVAGACERRQCGYVKPRREPPVVIPKSDPRPDPRPRR